jgi:hypothetical protein
MSSEPPAFAPVLPEGDLPQLGEIGLEGFAPYLMNRIMGRYNAAMREQMADLGLTTTKGAGAGGVGSDRGPADP